MTKSYQFGRGASKKSWNKSEFNKEEEDKKLMIILVTLFVVIIIMAVFMTWLKKTLY